MAAAKKSVQPAPEPEDEYIGDIIELEDNPTPDDLHADQLFVGAVEDTSHSIRGGEQDNVPGSESNFLDRRFLTPENEIKASAENAAVGGDSSFQDALIQRAIEDQVRKAIAAQGSEFLKTLQASIPQPMLPAQEPAPPSYKKHYRCDTHPDLQILALDMSSLDRGDRPSANPIPGEWIKFRRGHLYTSDDNVIRQIEHMKGRPAVSSDGQRSLGGNPSIYEDDDADIFRCTAGCDYITASKNAWKAHMMATHQVA